jgi:thioester reductase-like protein
MKTVLITGATGFLGGNLIKRLSAEGYKVFALTRNKEKWEGLPDENWREIEPLQGDITLPLLGLSSRRFRRLAWQVEAIFHCAALTDFNQQERLFLTNVAGTRHLLQFALLGQKKHFHHVSSAYVAGKYNGTFYEEDFNKNQKFNNNYEESKFNSEALVRRFAREHLLPFTIYRPSIIVGDSSTGHTQCYKGFYVFARALFLMKERLFGVYRYLQKTLSDKIPMRFFGDPEAHINLVPVDYVAEAIRALSSRPETQGKTFHLTNPRPITLARLTNKVFRALGIEEVAHQFIWYVPSASGGDKTESQPSTESPTLAGSPSQTTRDYSRLNPVERFFLQHTRSYLPYLCSRLSFDVSNTKNALNGTLTCPEITQPLISLLINKAVEGRWGTDAEADVQATTMGEPVCSAYDDR